MTENKFWDLIEDAWNSAPEFKEKRLDQLKEDEYWVNELGVEIEKVISDKVFPKLKLVLVKFSKEESFEFNRILERLLYNLDREEVHRYLEGGNDGFLYAMGFVVAMGREYYYLINQFPEKGAPLVSEEFAYMTRALYHQLYDDENRGIFEVDRETGSNVNGWK
ncbi:DUF4240 domain-containing protein [Chondrinema litorale]|uniref:DUF4240 domain-containing protein n=1 Tax=Chondrinema litorale TaxID=2994555 RepID=UPI002542AC89|nr:DUF4240 domain-containing protein [Chondrinema litorale]UZR96880.1 DUF4240 domain-containing protein [Chondrinema litorale]